MSSSSAVHGASGDGEYPLLQGGRGSSVQIRTGQTSDSSAEVVGHHTQSQPSRVGHELPRRQVLEAGALELGNPLLDDRVPTVVGLDLQHVLGSVGDERVVVPGGEQGELAAWC